MTKIPSVEETSRHFCNGIALQLTPSNAAMEAIRLLNKKLPQFLTDDRLALLTELREWARSKKGMKSGNEQSQMYWHGHADVLFALEAHINNLINPTNV